MEWNTEDLISGLNKNKLCNFIAYAVTHLQTVGINATIKQLKKKGIQLNGYILILAHPTTGRILKENDFAVEETLINIIDYTEDYKTIKTNAFCGRSLALKKSNKRNMKCKLYVLWTEIDYRWYETLSYVNRDYDLCFIRIDDGGGTYTHAFRNAYQTELYERAKIPLQKCKAFIKIGIRYQCNKLIVRNLQANNRYLDNRIFQISSDGKFVLNEGIVSYYKEAFKTDGKNIKPSVLEDCEDSILINTQCLFENKITDGVIDLNLYSDVVSIAKKLGMRAALKPHPREMTVLKYEELGIKIIPSNISQEVILANLDKKPRCIISIFSSTLLNAYGLFDIPVISLAKLMLKEDINCVFRKQLKDFVKQYEGIFSFPQTNQELEKMLKQLIVE